MKSLATIGLLSLAFISSSPTSPPASAPLPEPLRAADAPSDVIPAGVRETVASPKPAETVREIEGRAPGDLTASVVRNGDAWALKVARAGHLVALRRGGARVAGAKEAKLAVPRGGEAEPIVWETTHLDTLATSRGVLHVDATGAAPRARIALAEAPMYAGREARRQHRCEAFHDGAGGHSVVCRVDKPADALNITAQDRRENLFVAAGRTTVIRLDFPAGGASSDARVIGYADGRQGVVVRAEQSFFTGEDRPTLAMFSDDRSQPVIPFRRRPRYGCGYICDF